MSSRWGGFRGGRVGCGLGYQGRGRQRRGEGRRVRWGNDAGYQGNPWPRCARPDSSPNPSSQLHRGGAASAGAGFLSQEVQLLVSLTAVVVATETLRQACTPIEPATDARQGRLSRRERGDRSAPFARLARDAARRWYRRFGVWEHRRKGEDLQGPARTWARVVPNRAATCMLRPGCVRRSS